MSITVGCALGGIIFVTESVLVGILPPLGGVAQWYPNGVLLLISLAMGIACGLVVHILIGLPKQFILISAICSYGLIDIATGAFVAINMPDDISNQWLLAVFAITLAHVAIFSIGSIAGYVVLGKHLLRAK